jgi:hypothetical protein
VGAMMLNHSEEMRECYQQAVHCAQQADAQTDSKVKKQLLELSAALAVIGARSRVE